MNNLLLSERWRPKTMDEIILIPRIRNQFQSGLNNNVILYGHWGTGKTTLARILIGKWSKKTPFLEINSSFYTSIDVLRSKIDDFCSKVYMGLDLDQAIKEDNKYVFLDEFERTSIQYQDALKAYIEENSKKGVRFILTTNHINKISPGIRSRFIEVDFDCKDIEEEKFLKVSLLKKIYNEILPKEGIQIPKEDLVKLIKKEFPDFRSILMEIDNYKHTGSFSIKSSNENLELKQNLFEMVISNKKSFEDVYNFIIENFGPEKIDTMIKMLGKPLIEWTIATGRIQVEKLFEIASIVTESSKLLETSQDPIVLAVSTIGKIRRVINF